MRKLLALLLLLMFQGSPSFRLQGFDLFEQTHWIYDSVGDYYYLDHRVLKDTDLERVIKSNLKSTSYYIYHYKNPGDLSFAEAYTELYTMLGEEQLSHYFTPSGLKVVLESSDFSNYLNKVNQGNRIVKVWVRGVTGYVVYLIWSPSSVEVVVKST